jgi:hypothetical protein
MSVRFVLNALESSVTMDLSAGVQTSIIPSLDVSAVAVFQVSVDDMKEVFKYQTDSNDVTDLSSTDLKYYVNPDAWPELNPANAQMITEGEKTPIATANSSGALEANKMFVAHDFVRYLAKMLFNTHYGVDLFNNEIELLNNLRLICGGESAGQTWKDIKDKLTLVGPSGTHADIKGSDSSKYMDNDNGSDDNLCRVLLEQMTNSAITRFAEIDATDSPQSLPFHVDDSISFKLIVAPHPGQEELTGVDEFAPRSYEIRLNLVEAPVNTEVAADESE